MINQPVRFALDERDHGTILAHLQDGEWTKLFEPYHGKVYSKQPDPLYPIKVAMYREGDAIVVEEYQCLIGYAKEKNILASSARW